MKGLRPILATGAGVIADTPTMAVGTGLIAASPMLAMAAGVMASTLDDTLVVAAEVRVAVPSSAVARPGIGEEPASTMPR